MIAIECIKLALPELLLLWPDDLIVFLYALLAAFGVRAC
jgi:hypothetical protein